MAHQYYTLVTVFSETDADTIIAAAGALPWAGKTEIDSVWSVMVVGDSDSLNLEQYQDGPMAGWNNQDADPWLLAPDTMPAGVLIKEYLLWLAANP